MALTEVESISTDIEAYLAQVGRIFRAFRGHDSHCVSYGVEVQGMRYFVKSSDHSQGIASLERARHMASVARHRALPSYHTSIRTPEGQALVYDWAPGEVLWDGYTFTREQRASDPVCAHVRFRALPMHRVLDALDAVYDAHVMLADRGFVAVDLYDGSILYDFEGHTTTLCDLDEYHLGPFAGARTEPGFESLHGAGGVRQGIAD